MVLLDYCYGRWWEESWRCHNLCGFEECDTQQSWFDTLPSLTPSQMGHPSQMWSADTQAWKQNSRRRLHQHHHRCHYRLWYLFMIVSREASSGEVGRVTYMSVIFSENSNTAEICVHACAVLYRNTVRVRRSHDKNTTELWNERRIPASYCCLRKGTKILKVLTAFIKDCKKVLAYSYKGE